MFTHSPLGEVNNHPHHQDVSYAVHQVRPDAWSIAWNQLPTMRHELTTVEYALKQHVMGTVYWREYASLATTYQISAHEAYLQIGAPASEITYWGIANFGDHHEYLGSKYPDVWGFETSAYERERHGEIDRLARSVRQPSVLEIGAAEGHLARRLAQHAEVHCIEPAPTYSRRLRADGFKVVPDTAGDYGLIVIAAVLEYMDDPAHYLSLLDPPFIITDTNPWFPTRLLEVGLARYKAIDRATVAPRWEVLTHGGVTEPMRTYRIGAEIILWEQSSSAASATREPS